MTDLNIPGAAVDALLKVRATWSTAESFDASLHAIADPVVVAELRRLAAELEQLRIDHRADGWPTASLGEGLDRIRARIAELDPSADQL